MCLDKSLKVRKFKYDTSNMWNFTYDMLTSCLPYSNVITQFYNAPNTNTTFFLKDDDWNNCRAINWFLHLFIVQLNNYH